MNQSGLHRGLNIADALKLRELWTDLPSPSAIITSPPYLDMHDYGNAFQIGARGQSVGEYLEQVNGLFRDCFLVSTDNATLWLVAGSVRRSGRLVPLPDRLASCAEDAGWILREAITWDKQKALPWTHHGELRDITEQVLLFSKEDDFKFNAHGLRSPIPNSVWWRRYPERYSPNGYMPTNLWSISIPTQGAWSGVRSHFCPFPEELTYRMLSLTTVPGDTVLDPLAGVGSVPAMAEAMGRVGFGLELTERFAQLYSCTVQSAKRFLSTLGDDGQRRDDFRRTIIELRLLKFAKLLGQHIDRECIPILWVRVNRSARPPTEEFKVVSATFELAIAGGLPGEQAIDAASSFVTRPPLSKFGIQANIVRTDAGKAAREGHWFASGRFWINPTYEQPTSDGPHVVADFVPQPDRIDDTPYA